MSDTESIYSDEYKVDTWEALEKAKKQVMSNYMCKCCNIVFCEECLIPNARLKMCSMSLPLDIINNISSNIRCNHCLNMIKAIDEQFTEEQYFKEFGAPLELFIIKVHYYKTLNRFPDYDLLLRELFKDNERFDMLRYNHLIHLWNNLGSYDGLYEFKDMTLEKNEGKDDPYEELNFIFRDFMDVLDYIDCNEEGRNNILYGDGFGIEIANDLNDLFFGDSESEYDSDEEG